ncbi:MAG: hypothetical protein ACE5E4_11105 [Candidatus Binatia bacterium]
MVTDQRVRVLRRRLGGGQKQEAATAAGMSVRSARKWKQGALPSGQRAKRTWRAREDPFEGVWRDEIVPLLVADDERRLEATTVLS